MSDSRCTLLIVDDEPYILPTLTNLLRHEFEIVTAASADDAEAVLQSRPVDIVLTDQRMPGRTGVQFLEWVHVQYPHVVRLLMTGFAELRDAVEAINRGHVYYYLSKPWRTEELLQVLRNAQEKIRLERERDNLVDELRQLNAQLEDHVRRRTVDLKRANEQLQEQMCELEQLAHTDSLTGLLNRRAITEIAEKEMKRLNRYRGSLAIGIVDVDHFKNINSDYLLTGGDAVLRSLAAILRGSVRHVDAIGRLGGEEFMVVAPETSLSGAETLAERIRATVAEAPIYYKNQAIEVTVSAGFGVTTSKDAKVDFDRMHLLASGALREAKESGRNRTVIRSFVEAAVEQAAG